MRLRNAVDLTNQDGVIDSLLIRLSIALTLVNFGAPTGRLKQKRVRWQRDWGLRLAGIQAFPFSEFKAFTGTHT